jgi:hypothetical protein
MRLEELEAKAELRPKTFEGYAVAFRKIVGDIFEIEGGRERYDYQRGGREGWIARINAIQLAEVTPGKVQEWKRSFLAKAGTSHSDQRTARISVNSLMRRAKSLFAAKAIRHLERVKLPSPLPFDGIQFEKRQSMRYRSSFDVFALIEKAGAELAAAQPEQFKIFVLAVMAGLRRNEIDKLEWSAFRWKVGVIRIEATKWFHPKSEDSLGDVEADGELMELFRGYRARATGTFVVESKVAPRPEATFEHYRCQSHFEKLLAWLRKKGSAVKNAVAPLFQGDCGLRGLKNSFWSLRAAVKTAMSLVGTCSPRSKT